MGGECNYLLRVSGPGKRLEFVPDCEWKSPFMMSWTRQQCEALLDSAERLLLEGAHRLRLPVQVGGRRARGAGQQGPGLRQTSPTAPMALENAQAAAWQRTEHGRADCSNSIGARLFSAPPRLALTTLPTGLQVIRKERAVGVVPTAPTIYEVLEELAITVQVSSSSTTPAAARTGRRPGAWLPPRACLIRAQSPAPGHPPCAARRPPARRTSCSPSCPSAPSTAATTCLWMWATRAWA